MAELPSAAKSPQVTSAAIEHLKRQWRMRMYGADDLQGYYQAVTLGQYYNSVKQFAKAEKQYWTALEVLKDALDVGVESSEAVDMLMHIALEQSNQEQFSQSEKWFTEVRNRLASNVDKQDYARLLSYYALHWANQRKYSKALKYAEEATAIRRTLTAPEPISMYGRDMALNAREGDSVLTLEEATPSGVEVAHSLYVEAAMLERMEKLREGGKALTNARLVLSMAGEAPPLWEPQMYTLEGVVETSRNELPKAQKAREKALAQFADRAPKERPTALAHIDLGKALLRDDSIEEALAHFRQAVEFAKGRSHSFSLSQLAPYLKTLVELAGDLDQRAVLYREMFEAAQLVRTGAAAKEIARTAARLAERKDKVGRLIDNLQKQEYRRVRKQQELQAELGKITEKRHGERLDKLNDELAGIDEQIEGLAKQVQRISPKYKQLIGSAVDADMVFNALRPGEAFLQVLVGQEQSFVFLLRDHRMTVYVAPLSSEEVTQAVNDLRRFIGQSKSFDAERAYTFFHRLFAPISDELVGISELNVVPSGPLLSFPFGLFVTESPKTSQSARIDWLARRSNIGVVPSAQSFVYLRGLVRASDAPKPLIAFGDFASEHGNKDTERDINICQSDQEDSRQNFGELPGTRKEIEYIVAKFPTVSAGDLFFREAFNERAVKTEGLLKDYRVVYFATHGLLPDRKECKYRPSLVTSLDPHGVDNDDGYLTVEEILELQMNADLLVLSACDTAGAENAKGESLSGLARAFFFAGARSILVTHWKIADDATADLMPRVFAHLKGKKSVSEALRRAQIEMMDAPAQPQWSNPYFWAAFTLVGDVAQDVAGI